MVKNQPAKVVVLAWDMANGVPKTGDASNITGRISIDAGTFQTLQNSTPTELSATYAPGLYYFNLTAAETNGSVLVVSAQSTTPEVRIRPVVAYPTELPSQVSAIKEKTDNLPSDTAQELSDIETGVNILTARLSETRAGYLDNLSGGSVALEATAQSIKAKTDTITNEFNEVDDSLSTLLGRLTEVRAGYLDNLSGGNVALEATVQAIKGKTDKLPSDTSQELIDIETGVNVLTGRLSDTRAGYLDHLAGGNVALETTVQAIKSKTDTLTTEFDEVDASLTTLLERLTAARAGYLDHLSAGPIALEATAQAIKTKTDNLPVDTAQELGEIESGVGALTSRLTAARAGYLDNLSGGGVALEATVQAIKGKTDYLPNDTAQELGDIEAGVNVLANRLTDTRAGYLDHLSGGNVALEATVQSIKARTDHLPANTAQELDGIESGVMTLTDRLTAARAGYLDHLATGPVALETTAQAIKAKTDSLTDEFGEIDGFLSTLLGRLTAARADYLDNLAGGSVALETTVQAIKDRTDKLPADTTQVLSALDIDLDTAIANLQTLLDRLTAARAGYLDHLSGGNVALETTVQAIKDKTDYLPANTIQVLSALDMDLDTAVVSLQTLLNRLTAVRAGYLDHLAGGVAAQEDTVQDILNRVSVLATLNARNSRMDQVVYQNGRLTSARLRLYDTPEHAEAGTGEGLLHTVRLSLQWEGRDLQSLLQILED